MATKQSSSSQKSARTLNYWEIIADNLSKAGFSWGCIATINSSGQTIFVADAHRDDGNIVHADDQADSVRGIRVGNPSGQQGEKST